LRKNKSEMQKKFSHVKKILFEIRCIFNMIHEYEDYASLFPSMFANIDIFIDFIIRNNANSRELFILLLSKIC